MYNSHISNNSDEEKSNNETAHTQYFTPNLSQEDIMSRAGLMMNIEVYQLKQ